MKTLSKYSTLFLIIALAIFVNIIANFYHYKWDLTEEGRYSITDNSKDILNSIDDEVFIEVLLEGDFEPGFKKLKTETIELLRGLRKENGKVNFVFTDPNVFDGEEGKMYHKNLREMGVKPKNLIIKSKTGSKNRIIYPAAIVRFGKEFRVVDLLENQVSGMSDPHRVLNNSISLLEYKFVNAIKSLKKKRNPIIAFTNGHGELNKYQTADIEEALRGSFDVGRLYLDSTSHISKEVDLLVIASPRGIFSNNDKFKIDQYIMNGGNVIFMLDMLNVDLDSLKGKPAYVPFDYTLELNDLLFKYGARIKPNMVMDLECAKIPLNISLPGSSPQFEFFDWHYFPRVTIKSEHPIVKNLGQCILRFPSTIDTIKTDVDIVKTPLLISSKRTRMQFSPSRLSFSNLSREVDPAKFNKGEQIFGLMLEGNFSSSFKDRMSKEKLNILASLDLPFIEDAKFESSVLVISDGRFMRNEYDIKKQILLPAGYYKIEDRLYSNRDFMLNAIEYMAGTQSLVQARTKKVRLRMLDQVKANKNALTYQLKNVVLPLVILMIFGLAFNYYRQRIYR